MLLQVTACTDSGSVGGGIGGSHTTVSVDTMRVDNVQSDTLNSFSGNRLFFSIGHFNDPTFGDVKARGLIKPRIAPVNKDAVIDENTTMSLELSINDDAVYGDTLAAATFDVVEIDEYWRAPAWRIKDNIRLVEGPKVGSFTVAAQDSVSIPLSSDWVQKYGSYYNRSDSTRNNDYYDNFYGLALVSANSSKIIAIDPVNTKFLASNLNVSSDTTQSSTLSINLNGIAYSVYRSNASTNNSESTPIYNTLEHVLRFDFDFSSQDIEPLNVSKAELVISRDNLRLNQKGPNVVRPDIGPLRLHLVQGDELPQSLDPGRTITTDGGVYDADDQAYHFNLTSLISSGALAAVDPSDHFYITLGNKNGVIRSTILFDSEADTKSPKLIITSTTNR